MSESKAIFIGGKKYIFALSNKTITILHEQNGGIVVVNFNRGNLEVTKSQYLPPLNATANTFEAVKYDGPMDDFIAAAGQALEF
jgi:hypothetical protein